MSVKAIHLSEFERELRVFDEIVAELRQRLVAKDYCGVYSICAIRLSSAVVQLAAAGIVLHYSPKDDDPLDVSDPGI